MKAKIRKRARAPADRARAGRRARESLLVVPERVVMRLVDPSEVLAGLPDEDEVDVALTNQVDFATAEIAEALVASGKPLSHLHALRTAAEAFGFRRGYGEGARAAGWVLHGVARDAGGSAYRER